MKRFKWRGMRRADAARWAAEGSELVLSLLWPRRCPVCGRIVSPPGALICDACRPALLPVEGTLCRKCGKMLEDDTREYCSDCEKHRRSFARGFSLYVYHQAAADSMAAIKYKNKREYLDFYSAEIIEKLGPSLRGLGADALIPVPIHPSRMKKRGFNQAEVLAAKLSPGLGIPVDANFLRRSRETAPQKILGPSERLRNLESAFSCEEMAPAWMRRVILVDDIYTTGATAEACTRALQRAGVETVWILTICIGQGR